MQVPLLLACPGCTFSEPGFYLVCMVLGSIPVTWQLLREPAQRIKKIWGMPRITLPQIAGLLPLLMLPTIMFLVGQQKHDLQRCLSGAYGLVLCVVYLWIRLCWLMEQMDVRSVWSQTMFPGVIFPGMFVVGTVFGYSALGTLTISGFLPVDGAVFFLITSAIGAVLYAIAALLVKAVFNQRSVQLQSSSDELIIFIESAID